MKTKRIKSALHLFIALSFFASIAETSQAGDQNNAMPGQKESNSVTIDASKFSTLQSASDAVPESG